MAESLVTMKLLIDTQANTVLFAEASKECVDFLFHVLTLPVATVISLLRKQGMVGSVANLYESMENLNESYMQPNQSKDALLKPLVPSCGSFVSLLRAGDSSTEKRFYRCERSSYPYYCDEQACSYVSDDTRAVCPHCRGQMNASVQYVAPPPVQEGSCEGGFVKGVVTYMVMDDLVVKPMSTISTITLLHKFNVKKVGLLEEKVVEFGMAEAVALLKASLQSQKVLTDAFLKGK